MRSMCAPGEANYICRTDRDFNVHVGNKPSPTSMKTMETFPGIVRGSRSGLMGSCSQCNTFGKIAGAGQVISHKYKAVAVP